MENNKGNGDGNALEEHRKDGAGDGDYGSQEQMGNENLTGTENEHGGTTGCKVEGDAGEDQNGGDGEAPAAANIKAIPSLVPTLGGGGAVKKGKDEDKRKLFVGGLSRESTEDDLKDYFGKFGGVEALTFKTDAFTGRPRGFAFVTFDDISGVEAVIAHSDHVINGRKVDLRMAKARPGKIFVGGLSPEITDEQVKEYFEQYGHVIHIETPVDKSTNQRRNYCFVTFEDGHVSEEIVRCRKRVICGKVMDIGKVRQQQRLDSWELGAQRGRGGGRGMRGGRGVGFGGRGGMWSGFGGYGGAPDCGGGYYNAYDGYGYESYYGGYTSGYGYESFGGGHRSGYGHGSYGGGYRSGCDVYSDDYNYESLRVESRGRGGFIGKARGTSRGVPRHAPY